MAAHNTMRMNALHHRTLHSLVFAAAALASCAAPAPPLPRPLPAGWASRCYAVTASGPNQATLRFRLTAFRTIYLAPVSPPSRSSEWSDVWGTVVGLAGTVEHPRWVWVGHWQITSDTLRITLPTLADTLAVAFVPSRADFIRAVDTSAAAIQLRPAGCFRSKAI